MSTQHDQRYLDEFVALLLSIDDAEQMQALLRAYLSPGELKEIPKRLQITKQLRDGLPQREIAKNLGVGIATVTRGSKVLDELNKLKI